MNLAEVVTALQAKSPTIKRVLYGGYAAAQEQLSEKIPAVYVAPYKEAGLVPTSSNVHIQSIEEQFSVLLVCSYADYNTAREAVMDALLGKELTGATHLTEYVAGEMVEATGTLVYWLDVFQSRRERRVI